MNSIWNFDTERPRFDELKESISTDVLIIGGGIAGILCSYMLKNAGIDCVLIEADRICGGITNDTTAKITLGHGLLYDKLKDRFGENKAKLYLEAQQLACKTYEDLCGEISCNYEKKDSYVYSLKAVGPIKREVDALNRLGQRAEFVDKLQLPFDICGAVCIRDQAQFHPLKFIYSIAKDLQIYENTKAIQLMPGRAVTDHGDVTCKRMIIATHFPILNKHGAFFLKLYQHRSYVLALEGAPSIDGMYVDESDKGLSFRNYGDLLLLGGGGHRTGKRGGCWQELEAFAKRHYNNARIVAKWATQDCMTLDGIPYIGRYSKRTPDIFVATGFNKWGMTSSMVSALVLSDLICGKNNRFSEVFSPSRSMLHPTLAVNAFESTIGLLTPTAPRCPHLGCALKYNSAEHSWDCPCHGSRFKENGELINNPATDDKRNMPKA